jgi:hypothetical protein
MPVPAKGCDPVFPICQCGAEMSTTTTYYERVLVSGANGWKEVSRTFAICPLRAGEIGHDSIELTSNLETTR